jgi:hypothetical protein
MNSALRNSVSDDAGALDSAASNPDMVFLVGLPRSGTTWLQKLLGNHPDIGTAQESHLFNHFLGSQINAWDHMIAFEDGRGGIGVPAYQKENEFLDMLHRQVREVLSKCDEYEKGSVFVEKTPDHIRHILDIQRVLPEARIVLMMREPADIIESMLSAGSGWGRHWAPGSIVSAIRLCYYFSRKAHADYKLADQSKIHVIRYEDLRQDSSSVLRSLLTFMKVDSSDASIEKMQSSKFELHRYGEFARIAGSTLVEEPEGFARKKKGKLNFFQRLIIKGTIGRESFFKEVSTNDRSEQTLKSVK